MMSNVSLPLKRVREELTRRPLLFRAFFLFTVSSLCFYLGKRWAIGNEETVVYESSYSLSSSSPSQHHVSLVITPYNGEEDTQQGNKEYKRRPSSPPHVVVSETGVLQEDGSIITTEFPMDEKEQGNGSASGKEEEEEEKGKEDDLNPSEVVMSHDGLDSPDASSKVSYSKFEVCPSSMKEYIPCLDNAAAIARLRSFNKGEKWERHCPNNEDVLNCLIPPPPGYKYPIRWPKSRDEVWYSNVPHTRLVEDKGGQNWIAIKEDKFTFPGGGTQFAHGADQYLDQMEKMVPEIAFGRHSRVALDIGCGVASWGAYLMSRNVLTLSIAPKDVHENQIQFALERGVPAMVAALATHRLLYPSQAFDIIHCSRCRIEWTRDGGILLVEVNRVLRSGGYFAWAAQPVYKHEGNLPEEWHAMVNLTESLCWTLVAKEGYLAIWRKPFDNVCYENRTLGNDPPLCDSDDNPDNVWYVNMSACITPLPSVTLQHNASDWPDRLHIPPKRLFQLDIDDAKEAKEEAFVAEERYMKEIVRGYLDVLDLRPQEIRNVMDMNAGYGGFAAAIADLSELDWWVMNVVPINGPNTLPVIYDRGLIGVAHDWCESFDTYPRTYDLLHVTRLFSIEKKRCDMTRIVLEMDRILRPGGTALIRDFTDVVQDIEAIAKSARWKTRIMETENGPYGEDKLLICTKILGSI